jgi:hypothetical protein
LNRSVSDNGEGTSNPIATASYRPVISSMNRDRFRVHQTCVANPAALAALSM